MPRPPAGTPTSTNLSALRDVFQSGNVVPNALRPTDVPHIRRCMKAGLLVNEGRISLSLTEAGLRALGRTA